MANFIETAPVAPIDYELFIQPFLDDPRIDELPFDIINTKFVDRKMYFDTDFDGTATEKTTCGWTFSPGIGFTSKDLQPKELQLGIQQCYTPLIRTIFANGLPDGWQRGTLSPEVKNLMQSKLADTFNLNLLRLAFLGDDALPTDPYKITDGLYKRLQEGAIAGDGTVDAGVALTSTSLNKDNFLTTMLSIYEKMPSRMRRIVRSRKTELVWIWTDHVYAAYQAFVWQQTQTNAGIIQRESILNGDDMNTFLGIPILVVPYIDDALAVDFPAGSPNVGEDPYRVVLTRADNHKILLDANGFKDIHMWYEDKDDQVYAVVSALFFYQYAYGHFNLYSGF